jgi:hypothetical protein
VADAHIGFEVFTACIILANNADIIYIADALSMWEHGPLLLYYVLL